MLIVVSPAKTLDYETPVVIQKHTQPDFISQAAQLVRVCKKLKPSDISSLMKVSDKIAALNVARFAQWEKEFTTENSRQAILAFKGDVYAGLEAETFSGQDFDYAQQHFRMLSGLYGILKPLDLMQPYRLEMGTKLENKQGSNLYHFWGDLITNKINKDMAESGDDILVNLASNEYFKAVKSKKVKGKVITPVFKDCKNGQYKVISFFAKKARGMMAKYIIQNQVKDIESLKLFDTAGYYFSEGDSTEYELVFKRVEQ